jgi:hypothetical protein
VMHLVNGWEGVRAVGREVGRMTRAVKGEL